MRDEVGAVIDLFAHPGFQVGALVAVAAVGVLLAASSVSKRRQPGWEVALTVAVLVAMAVRDNLEPTFSWAVVVVASAGLLSDVLGLFGRRGGRSTAAGFWLVGGIGSAAFGWQVAGGLSPSWTAVGLAAVVLSTGWGILELSSGGATKLLGPMLAMSIVGAWVTVPETDVVVILLGSALVLSLGTLGPVHGSATGAGGLAAAAVMAWVIADGGAVRPWTTVASWAALMALPIFAGMLKQRRKTDGDFWILGIYAAYVVTITRVADNTESAGIVLLWSVALSVLAMAALLMSPPFRDDVGAGGNQSPRPESDVQHLGQFFQSSGDGL